MTQPASTQPGTEAGTQSVGKPGRLAAVDALRAVALLGILSVNIWFFAYPETLSTGMRETPRETGADQLVSFTATTLFEGKSYLVFSFLFGLSFVLQWSSAHRAGESEVARSVRRFTVLAVLGVLHGIFLFVGDILLAYALLGFALLGMRRIRTRWAITLAVVVYGLVLAVVLGVGLLTMALESTEAWDDSMMLSADAAEVREQYAGSLGSYMSFQLSTWALMVVNMIFGQGPMALAAFLIGLVVGRARILERIIAYQISTARLLRIMIPTLLAGLALSTVAAVMLWGAPGSTEPAAATSSGQTGTELTAMGLVYLAGPLQATGYVLLAMLVFRSTVFGRLTGLLAPAGRMSLTNYISQSVVLVLIFAALGLGAAGQLGAFDVGGIVAGLWLLQVLCSAAWFRMFRTGPLEGLVRAVTYRRAPGWR